MTAETDLQALQASADRAARLLKAMSNPHRLLILCMLVDSPGTSAGELVQACGLSPSATSQHLARMYEEGLVRKVRAAQRINYSINDHGVRQIISTLKQIYCP
ncbi:ArsR/SmtB family transcription factor [Pantoea sp. B65]|uniref:ArsR/SmtB family transcription factor n=1 Tax=Pantoea sp. B65 TaxID=2813359 RepID=UPI0039B426B3